MKRKTDSRIHRRDISLHPDILQGFSLFRNQAGAKDLELEFCDTLQRITRISYYNDKAVLQFDTSSIEAVCLVHFALRDDYFNEIIEYLSYLIWAEQAYIYGKYSIAMHFSKKFDNIYSDLCERVTANLKNTDIQFILLAHYFIFVHEITHFMYKCNQNYKNVAENLRKMMSVEAERYITQDGWGKEVALALLKDHIIGEELLCDSAAAISMTSFSKSLNMEVNTALITEIIEAQALINYINAVSRIIVWGGQIDKEEQQIYYQTLFRSLYFRVYSDKIGFNEKSIVKSEEYKNNNTHYLHKNFMQVINKMLDSDQEIIGKLYVNDTYNTKNHNEISIEERKQILESLKKHICLLEVEGQEYDSYRDV